MINATTSNLLKLILPNTNKALDKVLQELTPQELQTVSKGKDLKTIMGSLLEQSAKDPTQDKTMLELVKNSPTLKNLGNTQSTLKDLISSLKSSTEQASTDGTKSLEKTLNKFLDPIEDVKTTPIKEKMENSGVFLESKIKNLQTPKLDLKQGLQELTKTLDTTNLANVKEVNTQLKSILNSDIFKNTSNDELFNPKLIDFKNIENVNKKIQPQLEQLQKTIDSPLDKKISQNDVVFTKDFQKNLEKLSTLNKPEQLLSQTKTKEVLENDFKAVLLKAHDDVSQSSHPNKSEILKNIDKLTLQIDYNQLVSHLSNSSSLYVPYSWEELEDGSVSMKSTKNGKFFCDIDLQLKEYGELKLRLGMFEKKQLNINISTENEKFKSLLQEGIPQLKKQLFSVGIMPKDIRFLNDTSKETASYLETNSSLKMGFEVKA